MTEVSRRAVRDEIDAALLEWCRQYPMHGGFGLSLASDHDRRVMAGILRKVRDNELAKLEAELREAQAAIARVRDVIRRYDSPISSRLIEMALHGEEPSAVPVTSPVLLRRRTPEERRAYLAAKRNEMVGKGIDPELFDAMTGLREMSEARELSEARLRRIETRMAVEAGLACPEPGCGVAYRHQHGDVWWPPEGEPWPPRRDRP